MLSLEAGEETQVRQRFARALVARTLSQQQRCSLQIIAFTWCVGRCWTAVLVTDDMVHHRAKFLAVVGWRGTLCSIVFWNGCFPLCRHRRGHGGCVAGTTSALVEFSNTNTADGLPRRRSGLAQSSQNGHGGAAGVRVAEREKQIRCWADPGPLSCRHWRHGILLAVGTSLANWRCRGSSRSPEIRFDSVTLIGSCLSLSWCSPVLFGALSSPLVMIMLV